MRENRNSNVTICDNQNKRITTNKMSHKFLADKYIKSLKNLQLTEKDREIKHKMETFLKTGKGFSIQLFKRDFNIVVNNCGVFWKELGDFKKINISSSKSKKINNMIKLTRRKKGEIYYSCITDGKYAFVIPVYSISTKVRKNGKIYIKKEYGACYKIIVL